MLKLFLPPLRRRPGDTRTLFLHFLRLYREQFGGREAAVSPAALQLLSGYDFPGNVRELRNVAERLAVICHGREEISAEDMRDALCPEEPDGPDAPLPKSASPAEADPCPAGSRAANEREFLLQKLAQCGYNQSLAARELGIDRSTLWRRMRKYGIRCPSAR